MGDLAAQLQNQQFFNDYVHRQELILAMNEADLKEMTLWLATVFRSNAP